MKPIVGVMPLWDDEKESIWMLPGYIDGIHHAGGIPIILPFSTDETEIKRLAGLCDGFLFTGGHDVSPKLYNEEPLDGLVSCCEVRDRMEMVYLNEAISANKPVLGICRGVQFINAALGGTLYQDLPLQHSSDIEHHQSPPYDIVINMLSQKHHPSKHLHMRNHFFSIELHRFSRLSHACIRHRKAHFAFNPIRMQLHLMMMPVSAWEI